MTKYRELMVEALAKLVLTDELPNIPPKVAGPLHNAIYCLEIAVNEANAEPETYGNHQGTIRSD